MPRSSDEPVELSRGEPVIEESAALGAISETTDSLDKPDPLVVPGLRVHIAVEGVSAVGEAKVGSDLVFVRVANGGSPELWSQFPKRPHRDAEEDGEMTVTTCVDLASKQ